MVQGYDLMKEPRDKAKEIKDKAQNRKSPCSLKIARVSRGVETALSR